MAYNKSDNIPTQFEVFAQIDDFAYAARTRGLNLDQAKKLGLQVATTGQYIANRDRLPPEVANRIGENGYDARYGANDAVMAQQRKRYQDQFGFNVVPEPHPENSLRQDDPRYARRAASQFKPRFR